MTKKRIRYSEFGPLTPATSMPAQPPRAAQRGAPVDLARALTAAREKEAAAVAAAVAAPRPAPRRPTPARSSTAVVPGRALRDRVRARSGQVEVLLFRVANERFGIELAEVEEAIDIPPVHHVPEMPPAMLGVITVRGILTSVYTPRDALGLSLSDGTSALIFRRGRSRLAVVVDEVDDVMTLDLANVRDTAALEAGEGVLLGVVRQRDALLALVDADALIAACLAVPILETA
jgi:chemotaxis signal transduction protein